MSKQMIRKGAILESLEQSSIERNTDIKYVLCVDVETLTDFSQKVRIGYYEVQNIHTHVIIDKGIFYNIVTEDELQTIKAYAELKEYKLYTLQDFIQLRFYPYVQKGVTVVNHNINFDLGAMCTWYSAYGHNGFILKLCDCDCIPTSITVRTMERGKSIKKIITIKSCKEHPSIISKRLSSKKYTMYFLSENPNIGAILDTATIGRALLGPSGMSLKEMGKNFRCVIRKADFDDYDSVVNTEYLDYMIFDVQATLNLFKQEYVEYKRHGVDSPITNILSEASIGKAYFKQLGIVPFRQAHDNISEETYNIAMQTYYGARSEVKIRLKPTLIRYCDFKSQYPTVNALLHLQDLLLAEYIEEIHCVDKVQQFINDVQLDDLKNKETWLKLRVLVKIKPDNDILPCRFDNGVHEKGYAVCYVQSPENWYTLCDIVSSKLLTGKIPEILDAIELVPYGQIETNSICLFGDERYRIDLNEQDFFTRVIDLRTQVKKEGKKHYGKDEYDYYDSLQLALKLIANSTAYGILVETLIHHGDEHAGKYYAVPIATHITGGARLLLAIAEKLGQDRGLTYAFCDTDSMAYALPDNMDINTFYNHVDDIVKWFDTLSPYESNAALFELEDVNFYNGENEELYFFGVSCKRYAVYNKLPNKQYRLRKITAHATGRYMFDYDLPMPKQMYTDNVSFDENAIEDIDDTEETETELDIPDVPAKMKTWQYLIWYTGIEQAENGLIPTIPTNEWSSNIARYQESVNTPDKLTKRQVLAGIRPYSFLLETPVRTYIKDGKEKKAKYRYALYFSKTAEEIKHTTPYRLDNGQPELLPVYDTLQDRFKTFFSHPEMKASNGNEIGLLARRHEIIDEIVQRNRTGKIV